MSWKTFYSMLGRDAHVAGRNFVPLLMQTLLQPLLFVFVFGKVMTGSGFMPQAYKSLLLPGIMAIRWCSRAFRLWLCRSSWSSSSHAKSNPYLSTMIVLPVLLAIDGAVLAAGLSRFRQKALS